MWTPPVRPVCSQPAPARQCTRRISFARNRFHQPPRRGRYFDAKRKAGLRNFCFHCRVRTGIDQRPGSIRNSPGKVPRKAVGEATGQSGLLKDCPLQCLQLLEFMAGRVQSLDCPQTLVFGHTRQVLKNRWIRNGHHIWLSCATENPRETSPKELRRPPEKVFL